MVVFGVAAEMQGGHRPFRSPRRGRRSTFPNAGSPRMSAYRARERLVACQLPVGSRRGSQVVPVTHTQPRIVYFGVDPASV